MSEPEVRLCIIDPQLEVQVLDVLSAAEITCHGRHLEPEEVPLHLRAETILITSHPILPRGFCAVIEVTSALSANLPDLVRAAYPHDAPEPSFSLSNSSSSVIGVLPRVGVSTLTDLLHHLSSDDMFVLRPRAAVTPPSVLCAEIDDLSLALVFEFLESRVDSSVGERSNTAIVINKLPESASARRKFQALERELRAKQVGIVCAIPFDAQIQVTGLPSKRTIRAAQPLFDWIAKAN